MIDKQFEIYRNNVLSTMLEDITRELQLLSVDPLKQLGIGYCPVEGSWIFPERDTHGHVIGMMRRFPNGKKMMVKGSKRGYTYSPVTTFEKGEKQYTSGSYHWTRVREGIPCPLCKREDWCLVSSVDPYNPPAVICPRTKKGAKVDLGEGNYLHILKPEGNIDPSKNILGESEYPYLIVEGASDWAIGTSLGFITIGKPQANCSCKDWVSLLAKKDVIVLGENDGGPGEKGMNLTFETLKDHCNVIKLLPPDGVKDLREWYIQRGITRESILDDISKRGQSVSHEGMVDDISPLALARRWLDFHTIDGVPTIGSYNKQWVKYWDGRYVDWPENEVRGDIYNYFDGLEYTKMGPNKEPIIDNLTLTRSRVSDILDALNADCPITLDPPIWRDGKTFPNPKDLIVFKNGILNVNQYFEGNHNLLEPTPLLFTFNAVPHEFNLDAKCEFTQKIIQDILSHDKEKLALLQEWLGYNLLTDQSMEKFMLFVGRSRSGKSTLLDILEAMLGEEQCVSTNFPKLISRFGCQPLMGKLAAIMPDASIPRTMDATHAVETIKQITGEDGIGIDRKFLPGLPSVKLKCRFTIAVNTLPELPDMANALIDRINLLKFDECYSGREDRSIKKKIVEPKESEGIILWALEGLKRLKENGEFTKPQSSQPLIRQFKALSSPITEFVMECCKLQSSAFVSKIHLYETWKNWAISSGQRPGSHAQLNQQLMSLYPTLCFVKRTINRTKLEYVKGITITDQAKELYLEGEI